MSVRVPIVRRPAIQDGDLTAESKPLPCGRRFSVTVAEEALERMGPAAVEFIGERLATEIVYEQRHAIEATVHGFLRDRTWAEPIIHNAIKEAVREHIEGMFRGAR